MKKAIIISTSIFLIISISISCSKEELKNDTKKTSFASVYTKSMLPPINEFDCGAPDNTSPYPCPNANCKYMGWDCLWEVLIIGIRDKVSYNKAAELLDTYIDSGHTGDFFKNYPEEVSILMPEVVISERKIMLDDLKNQITTVRKHPIYSEEYEQEVFIYQIYVIETGESPNYGDL